MNHLLFSYGTLQLKKVQMESFGRLLEGLPDQIKAYRLEDLPIQDEMVLLRSGLASHPIAVPSLNDEDFISGTVFEITDEELAQSDAYEVSDYKRVEVLLASGKKAWIYVKK
ncbi:hypothetical protein GCM10011506_13050 [Marivirga lumbricoides]|uniref:Gamma-glutamylcyclotransferase AIG2-like domain-containing protein n=1 Tax=Marivirga lumbricoides TaxID=1046115 RepID=A0ABQ1LVG2_9BACT|nr:hypothetical protein GCM10011506_13050 [Marivirga lumbricoides]